MTDYGDQDNIMIKKLLNYFTYFSILIVLINVCFIYPSMDDFSYYVRSHDRGFWEFQKWHYFNWGGRYVPNAFLGYFNFGESGIYLYRAISIAIILGLYFSLQNFVKKVIQAKDAWFIGNIIFLSYLFSLFSISQAFYWMPGSITYTLGIILCLISWTLLKKNTTGALLICFFLAIILNGTNELTTIFYNGSLILLLLFNWLKNKKINYGILALLIASSVLMCISILAPGNTVRTLSETNENTRNLVFSLSRSAFRTLDFLIDRQFIFLILGIFLMKEIIPNKSLKLNHKFVQTKLFKIAIFLFPFIVLCFGIFPSYYGTGRIPPERMVNIISFFFVIAIIFSIMFYKSNYEWNSNFIRTSKIVAFIPILIIAFVLLFPNEMQRNGYDLLSGRSAEFSKDMQARIDYFKSTPEKDLRVKTLKSYPNTLLFKDISKDPENFFNKYYARFYNKNTVARDE